MDYEKEKMSNDFTNLGHKDGTEVYIVTYLENFVLITLLRINRKTRIDY